MRPIASTSFRTNSAGPTEAATPSSSVPQIFNDAITSRVPLTLAGHTHGGQLGFRPCAFLLRVSFCRITWGCMNAPQRLIELADARGFELRTPRNAELRGGSVSIRIPHAKEVSMELNANDIVCDYRPGSGVRFSPHFYTRADEIDAAFAAVDEILATQRWLRQEDKAGIVT